MRWLTDGGWGPRWGHLNSFPCLRRASSLTHSLLVLRPMIFERGGVWMAWGAQREKKSGDFEESSSYMSLSRVWCQSKLWTKLATPSTTTTPKQHKPNTKTQNTAFKNTLKNLLPSPATAVPPKRGLSGIVLLLCGFVNHRPRNLPRPLLLANRTMRRRLWSPSQNQWMLTDLFQRSLVLWVVAKKCF